MSVRSVSHDEERFLRIVASYRTEPVHAHQPAAAILCSSRRRARARTRGLNIIAASRTSASSARAPSLPCPCPCWPGYRTRSAGSARRRPQWPSGTLAKNRHRPCRRLGLWPFPAAATNAVCLPVAAPQLVVDVNVDAGDHTTSRGNGSGTRSRRHRAQGMRVHTCMIRIRTWRTDP